MEKVLYLQLVALSYELLGGETSFTYLIPTVRMVKVISLKMAQQFY